MAQQLTEETFRRHLNTKFRVVHDAEEPVLDLELIEVAGYPLKHEEHPGMERFTLTFLGRPDIIMPQHTYTLAHEEMGEFSIFLVPQPRDERGYLYQAVFNFFTE